MEYYQILNLIREPFSNSPEPEFFYQSPQHVKCLQNLELAIRLRRGLNVVIGNVGTGKTTLCRQLIGKFDGGGDIRTHLLLDPYFDNSIEFLSAVCRMFDLGEKAGEPVTEWLLKERIKNYLLEQGDSKENVVVLIIDEGQKIPGFCLEILREFLNYETSEYKLLQIVIFAQNEFRKTLEERSNFTDRINFLYDLGPLNFGDTRSMIRYRMRKASKTGENPLHFTYPAMWSIYRATGGYPRKIVTLCHQIILAVIVQNRTRVNRFLVRASAHREDFNRRKSISWVKATVLSGLLVLLVVIGLRIDNVKRYVHLTNEQPESFDVAKASEQSVEAVKNTKSMPVDSFKTLQSGQPVIAPEKKEGAAAAEVEANASTDTEAEIPPDPVLETINTPEYPHTLGRLRVEKGWIVSKMIATVYGFYNNQYRELVKKANPGIRNLNRVTAGDIISFPVISAESQSSPSIYRVQIGKKDELESAHTLLQQYSDKLPPMQILPYWNNRDGLKFSILIRGGFLDKRSAQEAIDELPALIPVDSKIVSKWEDDTVFFANLEMTDS